MKDPEIHLLLPILLLTPMESESAALIEGLSSVLGSPRRDSSRPEMQVFGDRVTVRYLGMGKEPSGHLSAWLSSCSFGTVVLVGFAGGISQEAVSGSGHVLARIDREGSPPLEFPQARWWAEALGLSTGKGVQVDAIISFPGEKNRLYECTRADIVDMESHTWMEAIGKAGVKAIAIRIVSDAPGELLPAELQAFSDPDGKERLLRGGMALLRRPGTLAGFLRLLPSLLRARKNLVALGRHLGSLVREGAAIR